MDKKIYIKDWLMLKPYDSITKTDTYYLKLSNKVKDALTLNKLSSILFQDISKEELNLLACFLTSYFEDLISETNLWNSFIRIHNRLYNKPLPFYNTEEYFEEEINVHDISFLIWYFINTIQSEKFISPINSFVIEIAKLVMPIFEKEWDYAPENKLLQSFYQIDEQEDDFYIARKIIDTILFRSYLFFPDTAEDLTEKLEEIILKEKTFNEQTMSYMSETRDSLLHKTHTRLLSLSGKEWVAEILGDKHKLNADYRNISPKVLGYFFYKGQDEKDIFLEHIASSKQFKLTKKSLNDFSFFKNINSIFFMGIVKWKHEWWFSGILFNAPNNAGLISEEKKSTQSRIAVDFLDYDKKIVKEVLENQFKVFKQYNNGSQIAFMESDKIEGFYKGFSEFYNDSLNRPEKEFEEAKKRWEKEGGSNDEEQQNNFAKYDGNGLFFFNPKSGGEMAFGINSAFPLPNNPYFDEQSSKEALWHLLMKESISPELAMFCIDNCKDNLPFFKEGVGQYYLYDIDFLLRFWKKDHYHTKPTITLVGQSEESLKET